MRFLMGCDEEQIVRKITTTLATLIVLTPIACAPVNQSQTPVAQPNPTTFGNMLEVTVTGLTQEDGLPFLTGIVANISGRNLTYAEIDFDLLDSAGIKVADAEAVTNGLSTGQLWRFKAVLPYPEVSFTKIVARYARWAPK